MAICFYGLASYRAGKLRLLLGGLVIKKYISLFIAIILFAVPLSGCTSTAEEPAPDPESKPAPKSKPKPEEPKEKPKEKEPERKPAPKTEPEPPKPAPGTIGLIGNKESDKLHNLEHARCRGYVKQMNEENKVKFDSKEEAYKQGYRFCKACPGYE